MLHHGGFVSREPSVLLPAHRFYPSQDAGSCRREDSDCSGFPTHLYCEPRTEAVCRMPSVGDSPTAGCGVQLHPAARSAIILPSTRAVLAVSGKLMGCRRGQHHLPAVVENLCHRVFDGWAVMDFREGAAQPVACQRCLAAANLGLVASWVRCRAFGWLRCSPCIAECGFQAAAAAQRACTGQSGRAKRNSRRDVRPHRRNG